MKNFNKSYISEFEIERKVGYFTEIVKRSLLIVSFFTAIFFSFKFNNVLRIAFVESVDAYLGVGNIAKNGLRSMLHSSGFLDVTSIKITSNQYLREDYLNKVVESSLEENKFISLEDIFANLKKSAIIDKLSVSRNLADKTIEINVKEKDIVGIRVDDFGAISLLDGHGNFHLCDASINCSSVQSPFINGENMKSYIELYSLFVANNISDHILKFQEISKRRWDIYFSNGMFIKMPADNLDYAVKAIQMYESKYGIISKDKNIEYIDLRVKGKIFVSEKNKNKPPIKN